MGLIIAEFIVIAIAVAICFGFHINIARTIPVAISVVILTLFLAGVGRILVFGAWIVFLEGALSIVFIFYKVVNHKRLGLTIEKDNIINPSIYIFVFVTIACYFIFKNYLFCNYDEFSHWGIVIKDIFIHNELCSSEANDYLFPNYPPGVALLQWFVMFCNGEMKEELAYSAYALLGTSFLLVPFEKKISANEIISSFIKVVVIVCVPFLFFIDIWSDLQVDALLGIICFSVLYTFYVDGNRCKPDEAILTSFGLVTLTLIKDAGVAIALLLGLGISLYYIIKNNDRISAIKNGFILLIPTIVVKLLWEFFWRMHGTSEIVLQNIADEHLESTFYTDVVEAFINKTFTPIIEIRTFGFNIYAILVLLFIIVSASLLIECKEKRYKLVYINVMAGAVFVAYTAGVLYIYLTIFPYEAAVQAPSFQRYESTILMGWTLLCITILIDKLKEKGTRHLVIAFVMTCIFCCFSCFNTIFDSYTIHQIRQAQRDDFQNLESAKLGSEDLVYVVTQNEGMAYYVANYTIAPAKVEPAYLGTRKNSLQYIYSLRKVEEGEAPYIAWDISCAEWETFLTDNHFNYVYLHGIDDYFMDTYGELFDYDVKEKSLYRIKYGDDSVRLLRVE